MAVVSALQPSPLRDADLVRLQAAVDTCASDVPDLCDEITRRVLDGHPSFRAAVGESDALAHRATQANVGAIFRTLALGIAPSQLDVPDGVNGLLDHVAVEAAALPTFLRAYRLAETDVNRWWIARLVAHAEDADQLARLAAHSMEHVAAYVDRGCEVIAARWDAMVRAAQRAGRQRDAAVRALLRGEPVDHDALDHPLDVPQLVIACHAGRGPSADRAWATGPALGRGPRLELEVSEATTLVVVAAEDDEGARLRAVLASAPVRGWMVAAFAAPGPNALAATARQVCDGLRVARRVHPDGAAVPLAEVALLSALLADEPRAAQVVDAVLGPLAVPTRRNADLRATVRAYFAAGERKAGTGARLGIHPKTVAHRLARVEQLLGAPIESRRIDLETALLLHQALARRGR